MGLPELKRCNCMQAVAPYKSKLPKSEDETEYIENLFNALCSTLMTERNRHVLFSPIKSDLLGHIPFRSLMSVTWIIADVH